MNRIATLNSLSQSARSKWESHRSSLTSVERALLLVGIVEIPLGIDKYFLYQFEHGAAGAVAGYNISVTTICLIALYALWIITAAKQELTPQRLIFGFPMLFYIGAVTASVVVAENRHLALNEVFLLTQAYALFFYVANRVRDYNDFAFIICCFAISLLLQGLVMIGLRAAGPSMYDRRVDFGPVPFSVSADGRTEGTMLSPVVAGSLMAVMFLVPVPLFITTKQRKIWLFLGVSLAVGLVGLLFTQTRGAIATVIVGSFTVGVGMLLRGWLPRWTIGTAVVAFLVALIPLVGVVQKRIVEGDDGSAGSRIHLSEIAVNTIAESPVFGHGAGNCHIACLSNANSPPYRSEWYYTIHCKYLIVWVETGLVGLLAFLFVLLNGFRYGVMTWIRRCPRLSPLGLGCAAAVLGHSLHMFVDLFNSRAQVQLFWVLFGLLGALYQQTKASSGRIRMRH